MKKALRHKSHSRKGTNEKPEKKEKRKKKRKRNKSGNF
jgi:hypothetical protein